MRQLGMGVGNIPAFRLVRLAKLAIMNAPRIEWFQQPEQQPGYNFSGAGFTRCCQSAQTGRDWVRYIGGPTGNPLPDPVCSYQVGCGVVFQTVTTGYGGGITIPQYTGSGQRAETIWLGPDMGLSSDRMVFEEKWQRIVGAHPPETIPFEVPDNPPAQPLPPQDLPLPWQIPEPFPSRPPQPVEREIGNGIPRPKPRYKPYHKPGIETDITPDGMSRPTERPHARVKPRPGERERKGDTPLDMALQAVAALYDATTEANDVVNVIAESIRGQPCSRGGIAQKMGCIYQNLDKLDVWEMTLGLARNHYEDKIYGRVFGILGKHTPAGSMRPTSNRPDVQVRLNR